MSRLEKIAFILFIVTILLAVVSTVACFMNGYYAPMLICGAAAGTLIFMFWYIWW